MSAIIDRMKSAWNAFTDRDREREREYGQRIDYGAGFSYKPDRIRLQITNERSIVASIQNRIGIDVAAIDIKHVRLDKDDRYQLTLKSPLNNCLTLEANIDQGARAFRQDAVMTMLDKGAAAIVPIDTTVNPRITGGYDILTMRVGEIIEWYPEHVKLLLYNQKTGEREEIILSKSIVAIAENPLASVMNQPNSTLSRLTQKLSTLDAVEQQAGKLDVIIQLPYVIKTEARREQAEERRKSIELQLKTAQHGIAYTDGTEKITQLNRASENNILAHVKYLTDMLYSQLGITPEVMNGTADEKAMLNYHNRTIEPIVAALTEAMARTFITKTARTQGHAIVAFRDPFRLVPIAEIAEIADKFTRNEIATANEIRGAIGWVPSRDPKADELQNSNMPTPEATTQPPTGSANQERITEKGDLQNGGA